jgi:hypothetical protein
LLYSDKKVGIAMLAYRMLITCIRQPCSVVLSGSIIICMMYMLKFLLMQRSYAASSSMINSLAKKRAFLRLWLCVY